MIRRGWALVAVAAGCGGDAPPPEGGDAPSSAAAIPAACELLTGDEVASIVGETVRTEQTDVGGTWAQGSGTSICNYYTQSPAVLIALSAMQPVSPSGDSQALAEAMQRDNTATGIPVTAAEPVEGVGDGAARWRFQGGPPTAHYLVAGKGQVRLTATAASYDAAQAMAETALARLP